MEVQRVAVLARGSSLGKFKKHSDLFKTIYIVGNFYKEIKRIGVKHFENKKIIFIPSRTDRPLRNDYHKKLDIIRIQTMYYPHQLISKKKGKQGLIDKFKGFKLEFLPDYMKNRGYPVIDREIINSYMKKYTNYKAMCLFLENNFVKEIKKGVKDNRRSRYWPTTGLYALDICLVEQNPDEIYLFGIDCYQYKTLSYSKYNWENKKRDHSIVKKIMLYHMEQLAKEFSFTKFYTSCDKIDFNVSNWNLI